MPAMPPPGLGAPAVLDRIAAAAGRAGRDPASVTLVGAAKTVDPGRVVAAGVVDVGENRVQELTAKQEALEGYPIRWHFIGRLQRNKAKAVAGRVTLVHSVDSVPLARALGHAAHARGLVQPALVQVNVSGEASKAGIEPAEVASFLASAASLEGVRFTGLMTVPAPGDDRASRAAFRLLAGLASENGLTDLSMGMSGDFEIAVEEGATMVRVGTAVYGPRPPQTPIFDADSPHLE